MEASITIQTLHAILNSKYVGPLILGASLALSVFALMTVHRIENVDLPEIRRDIKEIKQEIASLNMRVTRLEVRMDHMEEDIREIKSDIKEMKEDIGELKAGMKILLARKS